MTDTSALDIPQPGSRWQTRFALPLLLISGFVGVLLYTGWHSLAPAHPVTVTQVAIRSAAAGGQPISGGVTVQAPGWVEPDPYPIYATALVEGVVKEVTVLEGQPVTKGQVVATLFDEEFQLNFRKAQAESTAVTLRMEQLSADLRRKAPLVEHGAVSAGEVVRLELELKSAAAAVEVARAQEALAGLALDRTRVTAPAAGVVMTRLASPGAVLGPEGEHGRHVLHIYDPLHLQVRTDVPLVDAALLGMGQLAEVTFDALPGRTFSGKLVRLVHQADIAKNTVQAKVSIDKPDPALKPEMLSRVRIMTGTRAEQVASADGAVASDGAAAETLSSGGEAMGSRYTLFAPKNHLTTDGATASALVIEDFEDGKGIARKRAVTLGRVEVDGWIEVIEGLRPGDQLISVTTNMPSDGSRVQVLGQSAAAPASLGAQNSEAHRGHD